MMKIGTNGILKEATGTAGTIATNGATLIATKSWLMKAGFTAAAIGTIVSAFGSWPWAGHLKADNAIGTLTIVKRDAIQAGLDPSQYAEVDTFMQEVLNPTGWEAIKENIPYVNVLKEVEDIRKGTILANTVYDKIYEHEQLAIQQGLDENAKWDLINQERADQEKASVDYYNQQRIATENQILAAREAKDKARDRRERQRNDDYISAQLAYKQKLIEMEAADRQAQADFWLAYAKLRMKLKEDQTPSNLKFGLL